jgi:hypothetical protein
MRNDVIVAKALCEKLGIPHFESIFSGDLVETEMQKNEDINYEALEHSWMWELARNMADREAVSYDGIDGDVLSAGHFHVDENSRLYREGRFDELAQRLAPTAVLRLAPRGVGLPAADAYQRIVNELKRYRSTHNPMMFFFLYNRSRRAVSVVITHVFERMMRTAYAPFLDRQVFDFLAGLPEEMFADKLFHTQALSRKFPHIDEIGYAKKTPIPSSVSLQYARRGLRYAWTAPASPLVARPSLAGRFVKHMISTKGPEDVIGIFSTAVLLNQVSSLAERV